MEAIPATKVFKSYTLTWQQVGIFKFCPLVAGLAIGAYWHDFFVAHLMALVVIAFVTGVYVAYVTFKQ